MSDRSDALPRTVGDRIFSPADQLFFAAGSRDFNPMHMDPVAARRLLSGRQVVHGIHTLIQALDFWPAPEGEDGWSVQCNFSQPLNVGERVVFTASEDRPGRHRLQAWVDGLAVMDVALVRGANAAPAPVAAPAQRLGPLSEPMDLPPAQLNGQCWELEPWNDGLAQRYRRAARLLSAAALSDLARLSFVVGMVCPGLQSVFSSLRFGGGGPGAAQALRVQVLSFDERFQLFVVGFQGALQGQLRAFRRPPPQPQPRAAELVPQVATGRWVGRRALVVGGSRGLGETLAKLLAAASCDVTVTYASGRTDAEAVAADIRTLGRGACTTLPLDLSQPFRAPADLTPPDAVFYFATPRIAGKRAQAFQRAAFDEFVSFYVERFQELCLWLESGGRPVVVYLPSTVFIDERPKGMTEYAMAKVAAELLADELNRTLRHVRVVHSRLPRMATDQTAAIQPLAVADTVQTLLGVLRQVEESGWSG